MEAAEKLELIEWLTVLDDDEILQDVRSIKESSETLIREGIPEEHKEKLRRAERDFEAGRVHTSKEVWKDHEHLL